MSEKNTLEDQNILVQRMRGTLDFLMLKSVRCALKKSKELEI